MNDRESTIRFSRMLILGLMLIAPICGAGAISFVLIVAATITAYDGVQRQTVYGVIAAMIGIELIYGADVGILSVAYIVAVLVFVLVGRVITISPWSSASGWHLSDALRTLIVACGLVAIMSASAVIAGRVLYGYTEIASRLSGTFIFGRSILVLIGMLLLLITLRRIDEPFRRRITFGA